MSFINYLQENCLNKEEILSLYAGTGDTAWN